MQYSGIFCIFVDTFLDISKLNYRERRSIASPFLFILHGIPFEMPHAGSPNSTPYHPKCHTLASEMAGIYPPKPWGFREKP